MPWKVRKAGKRYAIIKKGSGKVVGHSTSKAKAEASVRARYANSPEASSRADMVKHMGKRRKH